MARTTALDVLIKYQNEQSYLNILNDYLEKAYYLEMIKIWLHELYMERFKISYILNINWRHIFKGKKLKIVRK